MSHTFAAVSDDAHLLIPFARPPGLACQAALATLELPHLQALLGRLHQAHEDRQDESSLSPPHERALAHALGLPLHDGLLPWAAMQARQRQLPGAGHPAWALLTLCHWQVGMSEVVLSDPAHLHISAEESQQLLDATRPFFDEDGLSLFRTDTPGQWLVSGAMLQDLPTASLDRAIGQPLAAWLPMSAQAGALRRLQNEMQMLLYTSPVNDARAARGQLPINSFWLSGTGNAPLQAMSAAPTVADELRDAALQDDGQRWAQQWQALDAQRLAPLAARARAGEAVTVTLCGPNSAQQWASRGPRGLGAWLRRRWRQPRIATVLEAL